ncbi:hypothetical protein [Rhodococcus erythropolis]|uniref:hypothetical protein n=1 Tax=Rhodococcus erythropolis TaxID=1833 RepID=UPI001BE84BFF|nr:hypothetical protein [Rhodococcus erythropolis]MBT2267482.1 hypothetical protein [Rhodococcus erythropolis]
MVGASANFDAMITPVVVDALRLRWFVPPEVGETVRWGLSWNVDSPRWKAVAEVAGALHLLAGIPRDDPNAHQAWIDFDENAATTGVVRRLRLMSIGSDMLPDPKIPHGADWGWATTQFVPGSERFYELARAPRALRSYQLADRDWGPRREEFLLVDLETAG